MTNTLKFGLAEALHALRESKAYNNPQFRYSVEQISKNFSAGFKEFQIVEGFLSAMSPYMWDDTVSAIVNPVSESVKKNADRLAAMHLSETLVANDRLGFLKDATLVLKAFINENKTSAQTLSALSKFSYDGRIKSFCNDLMLKEHLNMDIQRSTDTCDVSDVYSPVLESGNTTYFNANNTYFAKTEKVLKKLSKDETEALPLNFRNAVTLFGSSDIKVVEGRIVYRIGKDKYEFVVEGKSLKASLNGKNIPIDSIEHMADFSAKSIFEGNSYKRMVDIETIRDWASRVVKVDGVKVLASKVYTGLTATVFNVQDQLYVHAVNEGMKTNEFGKMSATAAINKIRTDLRFDISKSFAGMLIGEAKRMADLTAVSVKINENISALENKISGIKNINESADVDNAIEALRTALNQERAQYNQVNREITEIESAISEDDDSTEDIDHSTELDHADEDAVQVGDMVRTDDGKTGKVTGFSEEGEATVVLDGGEVIHPMIANLKKVQDELNDAIDQNNTPMGEAENLDCEEEADNYVLPQDVVGQTEVTLMTEPEIMPHDMTGVAGNPVQAALVISFGPYQASSSVEVDAEEFESKSDNENVTIKNPIDGIDLVPKKYLKVAGGAEVLAGGELPVSTVDIDEANKDFTMGHPEIGKIDLKVNTMGKIDGTHKMTDFLAFLDKHVEDKKITSKTRYANSEEEHEVYGDPKFFVVVDGDIEEGFVHEDDANDFLDSLKTMRGNDDGMEVVQRAHLDTQTVNDYLATLDKGHVEEAINHVDNSDMTLHDVMCMVMGEDHGITEEEILSQFSGEEVQHMKDFIRNHQDLIRRLDGIPYEGESKEWDEIHEPGKELLGKLLDSYEEAQPDDADEQGEGHSMQTTGVEHD